MWPFRRRTDRLLELQKANIEAMEQMAARRTALEIRRLELEYENLERAGEEKRKDLEQRDRLRRQKQEHAQEMRARRREKQSTKYTQACRVCSNPGDASLSASEILWHAQGHNPDGRVDYPWPQ